MPLANDQIAFLKGYIEEKTDLLYKRKKRRIEQLTTDKEKALEISSYDVNSSSVPTSCDLDSKIREEASFYDNAINKLKSLSLILDQTTSDPSVIDKYLKENQFVKNFQSIK